MRIKNIVRSLSCVVVAVLMLNASLVSGAGEPSTVEAPSYPRILQLPEGKIEIQMPQIESWVDYERLTAWTVMKVTPTGSNKTWIGTAKFEANSDIDFDERLVVIHDIEVVESKFLDNEQPPAEVIQFARKAMSLEAKSVPLDVVLHALPDDFEIQKIGPEKTVQLKRDPPVIYTSTSPTALMVINGEPIKARVKGTGLEFVVNTNWDLFYHESSKYYYVLNGKSWQRSKSLSKAKWDNVTVLPTDFATLPANNNWQDVRKHVPAVKAKSKPQKILVSLKPAELIVTDGKPSFWRIADTGIEWATNTEADLFLHEGNYYYLVSGRWFNSSKFKGPWQTVESLPSGFAQIPHSHQKGHVLTSVPGTSAARAAVIEANIPRKASVSADAGKDLEVVYDGDPKFVAIETTSMQRAANTNFQVILLDGTYYLCHNAVWFSSDSANGPWLVATLVPSTIYSIPASDPAHNVTYVYVYQEPEQKIHTHVTYAYTSGYYGHYSYGYPWGVSIVYGTGWYYPPYYYYGSHGYPAYYHYPTSYGYGSAYNPATGRYAQRSVAYGPYGGVAATSVYNPRTGAYGRGNAVWDSNEVARSGYAYNPSSRTYAAGNMYYDFENKKGWREGYVQRDGNWAYAQQTADRNTVRTKLDTSRGTQAVSQKSRNSSNNGLAVDRATAVSGGGGAKLATARNETGRVTAAQSKSGNLYAGQNGNVYKRNDNGQWSQYQKGEWGSMSNRALSGASTSSRRSKSTLSNSTRNNSTQQYNRNKQNLNRQYNARQSGSRNYSQFKSMGGSTGARRSSFGGRRR